MIATKARSEHAEARNERFGRVEFLWNILVAACSQDFCSLDSQPELDLF